MKLNLVKAVLLSTTVAVSASMAVGCVPAATTGTEALALGTDKYGVDEAKLYLYDNQFETEMMNELYVAYIYGSFDSFWSYYADECKTGSMKRMLQVKILNKEAAKRGVTLTSEEEASVQAVFDDFMENKSAVMDAAGVTEDMVKTYLHENAVANKMYVTLTEDVDTEMDAEAMHRKQAEGLSVRAKTTVTVTPATDTEEAVTEDISAEDQTANREKAVADVMNRLEAGETVSDIAAAYTDDETVYVTNIGSINAAPTDVISEGASLENYNQVAWPLSTGECAEGTAKNTSGEDVTYCVRMVDDDSAELRAEAEKTELAERKSALFSEKYAALLKNYKKYHVYEANMTDVKLVEGGLYESQFLSAASETPAAEETSAEETSAEETSAEETTAAE